MADIKITDLSLNGNDLFDDDEDFMDELDEDIFQRIKGGTMLPTVPITPHLTPNTPVIL